MRFINYLFFYYSCILFEWCSAILIFEITILSRSFFFSVSRVFSLSAGLTGLMFGRLRNDVEIHYPGFRVPLSIERGMYEKYWSIREVLVEVRSDGKSGYAWFPSFNLTKMRLSCLTQVCVMV